MILVSAQGPNPSFFLFLGLIDLGVCWDRGLDLDLEQGLTIIEVFNVTMSALCRIVSMFYRNVSHYWQSWHTLYLVMGSCDEKVVFEYYLFIHNKNSNSTFYIVSLDCGIVLLTFETDTSGFITLSTNLSF